MNNSSGDQRFRIPDELWEQLEPLLPIRVNTHRFGGGLLHVPTASVSTPSSCPPHRLPLEGALCDPVRSRFDRPRPVPAVGRGRCFLKSWEYGLLEYDYFRGIDWTWSSMDGR